MTNKPISEVIRDMREHADYIRELQEESPEGKELLNAYDRADTLFGAENVKRLIDHIAVLEQKHCGAALMAREEHHVAVVGKLTEHIAALEQRESRVTAIAKDGGELFDRMAEHLETSKARIAELEQQLAAERARGGSLTFALERLSKAFIVAVGDKSPFAKEALKLVADAIAGIPVEGE